MLRGLNIKNMLLIDQLELDFQPGLNVLTGETGAGKSILLDSLGFVLGWRGRADMVRQGADMAEVSAWFDLPPDHPAHLVLRDIGLPEQTELILRRTNTPDGRKTAYVNDRRCTAEVLRRLSDCLVELHGLHDDKGLLNPNGHITLLDSFAGLDLDTIKEAWRDLKSIQKELETAQRELESSKEDTDYIQFSLNEIKEINPINGEDAQLDEKRRLMQAGERIREDIAKGANALGPQGAETYLHDATKWLQSVAEQAEGRLEEPISALSRAMNEIADAQNGIENCLDALDFDASELEQIEERLFAIRALARKHKIQPDDLENFAHELERDLKTIDLGAKHIQELQQKYKATQAKYDDLAKSLHEQREQAGKALDARMLTELAPLKMEKAIFQTNVAISNPGPSGYSGVDFNVSTNPGAPAGPLNKIASGGELSRFLLALKVCLTSKTDGLTLIFDEIDRGVGGATADAVGRRLLNLSHKGQTLVVTHSPQVSALASHHWKVVKVTKNDSTLSSVLKLSQKERVQEIARMLSGDTITPQAMDAAQALLDQIQ